ncbi:MAG: hypothetical protein ACPGWM_09685 [Flavobacteriales bacterium]
MKHFLKLSSCFAFAMLFGQLQAQMLSPSVFSEPQNHLLFHAEFQKQNRIKVVNGTFSQKRVNERIKSLPGKLEITFDSSGRLTSLEEIKSLGGRMDTSFTQWNYVNNSTYSIFKADDLSYICTVYREKGDTILETAYRTPALPTSTKELTEQDLFWSYEEMCIIEKKDPKRVELFHNSIGLPYMRRTTSFNDLGYVTEIEERLLVTDKVKSIRFSYNDKGQIIERRKYKGEENSETTLFDYSSSGNLLFWDNYKKDILSKHHEVLYDSNGLVEAIILKHLATERIEIVQYSYEFYP